MRINLKFIAFASLFLLFSCANNLAKELKKAEEKWKDGDLAHAKEHYQAALKLGGDQVELNYKIAECYRKANDLVGAEPYYNDAVDAGSENAYIYIFETIGKC